MLRWYFLALIPLSLFTANQNNETLKGDANCVHSWAILGRLEMFGIIVLLQLRLAEDDVPCLKNEINAATESATSEHLFDILY